MFDNDGNLQILGKRLALLADVLGGRAPTTPQAIDLWKDAMRGLPLAYAIEAVNNWAAYHSKFPTPADIRRAAEESFNRDREERERQRIANAPKISEVVPADKGIAEGMRRFGIALRHHTPVDKIAYREAVVFHADYLAGKRPRDVTPLKWRSTVETFPLAEDPQFVEECRQALRRERMWRLNLPRPSDYAGRRA